jgi:uncharacterized protein
VAPYAYSLDWLMMYSDTSKVLTLGIIAVVGMILGSAMVAVLTKTFRWESFRDTEDTVNHLVGAGLMGFWRRFTAYWVNSWSRLEWYLLL